MRENPERFAWQVLLAAFAAFLLIFGSAVYGVQWYVLRSRQPMDVTIMVSRGTVSVVPPATGEAIAVTSERQNIEGGTRITTDSSSQGLILFADARTGKQIAQWVLHLDSDVTLGSALAPRFGLNQRDYLIIGTAAAGRSEAYLFEISGRQVDFTFNSDHGTALLNETGHYLFEVSDENTQLTTRQGQAEIIGPDGEASLLGPGERAIVRGSSRSPLIEDAEFDLLGDSFIEQTDTASWDTYQLGIEPFGEAGATIFDGRSTMLIDRSSQITSGTTLDHGEVGLEKTLDQPIEELLYLEIRASFQVQEQSLSTCGIVGSECPLMIRMDYLDLHGQERVWIHGFYTTHNSALNYPLRCDTCPIDHERVAINRWHTFESGNLMALLPPDQKPAVITNIRVYASGHAFKLYLSEMSLLVSP